MKINNMKINAFGNLKDKELQLSNGINIIKGQNESGKSTLLKFIIDMFYGISKNKRGKDFSDYEKYKPWDGEEFSGKINYTLDNNDTYEVFRDFNKKNPVIYNQNYEDISKQYNIDKTNGSEFFIEQSKIDETIFSSTLATIQQEVQLDRQTQNMLIQKIANFAGTGDDNVSYKKAVEKLNKKQVEDIGTSRTQGRPINIVQSEEEKLKKDIDELVCFKDKKYEIEEIKNKIEEKIKNNENKLELINEIKKLNDEEKIENEKLLLNKNILLNDEEKINKLNEEKNILENNFNKNNIENSNLINNKNNIEKNNKINKLNNKNKKLNKKTKLKNNKKINNILIIFTFLIIIISIINLLFIKIDIIKYFTIVLIPIMIAVVFYRILSQKNIEQEKNNEDDKNLLEYKEQLNKINLQIELLENNNSKQKIEIEKINNKINSEINLKKEKIKNKYLNKIKNEELNYYLNNKNINFELELINNELNKNKLEYHSLELDKNNIIPKLEKLMLIEEQYESLKEQEGVLLKDNKSIEIAKDLINRAYQRMKENVTPKFTNNLSENISKISNGKYKNVKVNDEEGLIVEKENGEYISISKLSTGTIDQLYMSLRFAIISELSQEKMPIILDEAFAYYDENRLQNILNYLNTEFKDNQIIIFTCTNRENEILNKLNINFNLLEI